MGDGQVPARILLADEQSLFREAVKVILDAELDLQVVAEAADGLEAVAEAERSRPDLVLLDATLPNCDGVRATALIRERLPDARILFLAAEEEETSLVEAMEAGANGYLAKSAPLSELIEAARAVRRGETLVPRGMLGALLARLIRRRRGYDEAMRRVSKLTRREREVLALLADGGDKDAIAQALVISPETARTHIQNVLSKLEVHSRLEAAAFVSQNYVMDELIGAEG